MTKRMRDAVAAALGARRVCEWYKPHVRAKAEGRPFDHERCNDLYCGCHCQDPLIVN